MCKKLKVNQKVTTKEVIALKKQGMSNRGIANKYQCSPGTIGSHIKRWKVKLEKKNALRREQRKANLIKFRLRDVAYRHRQFNLKKGLPKEHNICLDDRKKIEEKLASASVCYITGVPLDLTDPTSFEIDHIVPLSKGGKSDIDNLCLTRRDINQAKCNMTPHEFITLCAEVALNYFKTDSCILKVI